MPITSSVDAVVPSAAVVAAIATAVAVVVCCTGQLLLSGSGLSGEKSSVCVCVCVVLSQACVCVCDVSVCDVLSRVSRRTD